MIIKPITNEYELKQAIELDKKAYKDETLMGSLERCKQWLDACPDMYISIYDNEKMVGYINFVPLTPACFEKFKNGEMSDDEIQGSDILPYHKGKNLCLLMSIVVDEKYQNGETINLLTNALFDKINSLAKEKKYITKILAECVSIDGKKYVTRTFDSKKITNSKNGEIYLCTVKK